MSASQEKQEKNHDFRVVIMKVFFAKGLYYDSDSRKVQRYYNKDKVT